MKPDKPAEIAEGQRRRQGAVCVKYMKRFFTIDGVALGDPPRELAKAVKCVKYYSYWEFDDNEHYGLATRWFFEDYLKALQRLPVAPFDIMCGNSVV